jgi:1-acyl-sn-glycerol-3-phosphate acyltransferase
MNLRPHIFIRLLIRRLVRLLVRLFYREIEVRGDRPVGPVVYALNHPNALVDAALIFDVLDDPPSFLAKEPVLCMPVIGWLAKTLRCLPVYRKIDGRDPSNNAATLQAARELLDRGQSIAIFPEGTSHCHRRLLPLRKGAARIAAGAAVPIVPVALRYQSKGRFRSRVVVEFAAPIAPPVSADAVEVMTTALQDSLSALVAKPLPAARTGQPSPLLLPLCAAVAVLHAPALAISAAAGAAARRHSADLEATAKVLGGALFLASFWLLLGLTLALRAGGPWLSLALLVVPAAWLSARARDARDDLHAMLTAPDPQGS